jgi:uncharacterized membrane protein
MIAILAMPVPAFSKLLRRRPANGSGGDPNWPRLRNQDREKPDMRDNLIAFAATAGTLLVLDIVWLSQVMGPLFQRALGPLLAENVNYTAAGAFYLLYAVGTVFFAVRPALESGNAGEALLKGAALGLLAYATYDLTNMATLKTWPVPLAAMDVAWGATVTGVAAMAGAWAALRLAR